MKSNSLMQSFHETGSMHLQAGQIHEALATYKRALAYQPNDAFAHVYVAHCLLLLGKFPEAWPEYEWRLRLPNFGQPDIQKDRIIPFWHGGFFRNKTIIVNPEQGLGDMIFGARYLPFVKARGGRVMMGCHNLLYRLFSGIADSLLSENDKLPPLHLQIPLMSLPGLFGTTLENIPNRAPYLSVPAQVGEGVISRIKAHSNNFRVGLIWRGISNSSLSLNQFSSILEIPGIQFFSLQKGPTAEEIKLFPAKKCIDLADYLDDLADTAAAIQHMDLVISVDTSIAHLAGALARPVWTLIPFAPDWRWMLDRQDSPWYPTMRLFRQPAPKDWSSVIARVAAQLTALVHEQSISAATR